MKTLKTITLLLVLWFSVAFGQQNVSSTNNWIFDPVFGYNLNNSKTKVVGSIQTFLSSGESNYFGGWFIQTNWYKDYNSSFEIKNQSILSVEGKTLDFNSNVSKVKFFISLQDSLNNWHSFSASEYTLSNSWDTFSLDLSNTELKKIKRVYISLITISSDSSYVSSNIALRNLKLDNILIDFNFQTVGVEDIEKIPDNFVLEQNYPNPFNPSTTIQYSVPSNELVTLKVYDILGREIATLVNEEKSVGNYEVNFNAENLSSGVYLYILQAENHVISKKMNLVK